LQRSTRHIIASVGYEPPSAMDCSGSDNETENKQENTQKRTKPKPKPNRPCGSPAITIMSVHWIEHNCGNVHNTAENSSDNLSSYSPNNRHRSDVM